MTASFTAALLLGGRSRRMGRDKAYLANPDTGQASWERQADLLETLAPHDRFLSLRADQSPPSHAPGWQEIPDEISAAGPIAGFAACLAALRTDLLLVLAVDLLAMTRDPLDCLLRHSQPGCGAVFRHGTHFEPLAAVYPHTVAASADAFLAEGGRRLQDWVAELVRADRVTVIDLPPAFQPLFLNVNDERAYANLTGSGS